MTPLQSSLGFLSTGTKELPGNNGMFDMILAVNWVRDYISFFDGNPNKIVAFGHGTGASSAMMLSLSKFCKSNCQCIISRVISRRTCLIVGNKLMMLLQIVSAV